MGGSTLKTPEFGFIQQELEECRYKQRLYISEGLSDTTRDANLAAQSVDLCSVSGSIHRSELFAGLLTKVLTG